MDELGSVLAELERDGLITRKGEMVAITEKGRREVFALVETDPTAAAFLDKIVAGMQK